MGKFSLSFQVTEYKERFGEYLTVEQASFISGIDVSVIRKIISFELVEFDRKEREVVMQVDAIPTIRKIARLHYDLGIGWNSMAVVLDLLERIDKLESRLG